jgi:O-antigen ligase
VNQFLLLAVPVLLVYVLVGWDHPGAIFAPVRALSTAGSNEDVSSLARLEEIRNLLYTLTTAGNPLLGTGWGIPYQKTTSIYANFGADWWQYPYLPHNSLLGVAVFGGLVGILGIWLVVPVAAFLATRGYLGARGPADRAAALAALCILPAYGAHCYGDIGFQSLTCGLILGVALGVAGKVSVWAGALPAGVGNGRARVAMAATARELIPERQ